LSAVKNRPEKITEEMRDADTALTLKNDEFSHSHLASAR
jgi:hypothetical protein